MFQPTFSRLTPSIDGLAATIPRRNPLLVPLMACDGSTLCDRAIQYALQPLFDQGLAYLCTWGPDCERIHDLADQLTLHELGGDLVMTTWHDKKSLKEAVWYLIHCAEPANEQYADDCDQVAVAAGNESWHEQMEVALQELQCAFSD